jgi:hypothetical protein
MSWKMDPEEATSSSKDIDLTCEELKRRWRARSRLKAKAEAPQVKMNMRMMMTMKMINPPCHPRKMMKIQLD